MPWPSIAEIPLLAAEVRALVGEYHREHGRKTVPADAVRAYFQFQMLPDADRPADDREEES